MLVDPAPRLVQLLQSKAPRLARVGLVEPEHVDELLPELLDRPVALERREDRLRPLACRPRDNGPVGRAGVDHLEVLALRRKRIAACERRIDPCEQPRWDLGGDRDADAVAVAERQQPLAVPGRDDIERGRVGVLETRALDVGIEVPRVDEQSAAVVGRDGDRFYERGSRRLGDDPDDLAGLDVRADLDDQAGVACQELAVHS